MTRIFNDLNMVPFAKLAMAFPIATAVSLMVASSVLAGQWTWKELYDGGNYIEAADGLKVEMQKKGKDTAANNYYYADCLYRLDKVDEALKVYSKVYRLAPQTQFGKNSRVMLERYSRLATKNVTVGSTPAHKARQTGISTPWDQANNRTQGGGSQVSAPAPQTAQAQPPNAGNAQTDEITREIQRKLPKLVRTPAPRPTQAEMGGWSMASLAGYCGTAQNRVNEAEAQLESANQLLHQATLQVGGAGSPFRKYGESDQETKARLSANSTAIDQALTPFNEYVGELTSRVSEQRSILNMCINARNQMNFTPSIGIPVYRGW